MPMDKPVYPETQKDDDFSKLVNFPRFSLAQLKSIEWAHGVRDDLPKGYCQYYLVVWEHGDKQELGVSIPLPDLDMKPGSGTSASKYPTSVFTLPQKKLETLKELASRLNADLACCLEARCQNVEHKWHALEADQSFVVRSNPFLVFA